MNGQWLLFAVLFFGVLVFPVRTSALMLLLLLVHSGVFA